MRGRRGNGVFCEGKVFARGTSSFRRKKKSPSRSPKKKAAYKRRVPPISTMGGTICAYEKRHDAEKDPRRARPAPRGADAAERLLRGVGRRRKPHTKSASRPFQQWAGRFALMRSGMMRKKTPAAPAPPSVGRTRLSGFLGERGLGKEPSFSRKKVPSPEKPHVPHITQNIAFSVAGLWLFCVSDA